MAHTFDLINNELDWDVISANLEQFNEDTHYLYTHRKEWMRKYPNHWVVVFKGELVSYAPKLGDALAAAEAKGVSSAEAAIDHLFPQFDNMILPSR
jgi:hypothetical protein